MKPKRNGSRIPIDYEKVRVLALLNPSNDELAWALGIFWLHCIAANRMMSNYRRSWKPVGIGRKLSIKRMQWKAAQEGNTAILIWLGKQELGQREPDKI